MWFWRSNETTETPDTKVYESIDEVNLENAEDKQSEEPMASASTTTKKVKRQPFVPKEGLQFTHKKELLHEEGQCSDEHLIENLLTEQVFRSSLL